MTSNKEKTPHLPLYRQVEEKIRNKILDGTYPVDTFIPTEKELQAMYQVSRMTVRLAVEALVQEGLVKKEHPKGTRVCPQKIVENLNAISSFHHEMEKRGLHADLAYVHIEKQSATQDVAQHLNIDLQSPVYELYRLYTLDHQPLTVMIDYMPSYLDLSMDPETYRGSLYAYLEQEKKILITQVTDTISLGFADERLAKELEVESGAPLLKRCRRSYDQDHRIIEYVITYYRGDRYMYSVTYGKETYANS